MTGNYSISELRRMVKRRIRCRKRLNFLRYIGIDIKIGKITYTKK